MILRFRKLAQTLQGRYSSTNRLLSRAGSHERALRAFFGDLEVPAETVALEQPVSILIFINRSGSTLIAEYLRATREFSGFGEPLSHELVIERCRQHGLTTFKEYLEWLMENICMPGTQFGMKANLDQVLLLLRSGAIGRYFANVKWIFVQRVDVLSQAVSYSIAQQTQQWVSVEHQTGAQPEYRFDELKSLLYKFSDTYAAITALLGAEGISPYHLTYEQFRSDPQGETVRLAQYLGVERPTIDTEKLRMEKQASDLNREFCDRFVKDMSTQRS